jgi:hypothetical protein
LAIAAGRLVNRTGSSPIAAYARNDASTGMPRSIDYLDAVPISRVTGKEPGIFSCPGPFDPTKTMYNQSVIKNNVAQ